MNGDTMNSEGQGRRPVKWRGLTVIGVLLACVAAVVVIALVVHHRQVVQRERDTCEFQMIYQGYSVEEADLICANK